MADPLDTGNAGHNDDNQGEAVTWASPGEFGQPFAVDAKTGVATPLLAGFSIALFAGIAQAPTMFRWPGMTMFVMILTVGLLVLSLGLGFRSRAWLYSRSDAMSWGRINRLPPDLDEKARAHVQRTHIDMWRRSQRFVQLTYNIAIALLALALSSAAAPPASYGNGPLRASEEFWRWAGCTAGLIMTVLQIGWILHDERARANTLRRLRLLADTAKTGSAR